MLPGGGLDSNGCERLRYRQYLVQILGYTNVAGEEQLPCLVPRLAFLASCCEWALTLGSGNHEILPLSALAHGEYQERILKNGKLKK